MRSVIYNSVGGAELQADYIGRGLSKIGYEVHYVFEGQDISSPSDSPVKYYSLPDRGKNLSFLNYFRLSKLISKIEPDIIYQRVRFSYTGLGSFLSRNLELFLFMA